MEGTTGLVESRLRHVVAYDSYGGLGTGGGTRTPFGWEPIANNVHASAPGIRMDARSRVAVRFIDVEVGEEYGLRLKVAVGQPLHRVLVLDKVQRNKQVKVRHLEEPDPCAL